MKSYATSANLIQNSNITIKTEQFSADKNYQFYDESDFDNFSDAELKQMAANQYLYSENYQYENESPNMHLSKRDASRDGEQMIQGILFFINLLLIACGIASNLSIIVMTRYFPSCTCFSFKNLAILENCKKIKRWSKKQFKTTFRPESILLEPVAKIDANTGQISENFTNSENSKILETPTTCESISPHSEISTNLHTVSQTQLQISLMQIPETGKFVLSPSCQSLRNPLTQSPANAPLLQDQRTSSQPIHQNLKNNNSTPGYQPRRPESLGTLGTSRKPSNPETLNNNNPNFPRRDSKMSRNNSIRTNSITSENRIKNPRIIAKPCHFSKSTFNFLVANMATADMVYLASLPFILLQHVTKSWVFGRIPCKVFRGLDMGFFISCPYFMVLIAVDRLLTIYNAKSIKSGKSGTWIFSKVGIVFTWLIFFVNFTLHSYFTNLSFSQNTNASICTIDFTPIFGKFVFVSKSELQKVKVDIQSNSPGIPIDFITDETVRDHIRHTKLSQYHAVYVILVGFAIPAALAILSYGILISKMAKFDKQRNLTHTPLTSQASNCSNTNFSVSYSKTIYKRATWVVSIFMFTLAPYIALNYLTEFYHELVFDLEKTWPVFMYTINMFCQFSAQFNQIFGPTLYAYNNPKFQTGFKAYVNYLVAVCINKNERNKYRSNSLRSNNTIITTLPASTRNTVMKTPQ